MNKELQEKLFLCRKKLFAKDLIKKDKWNGYTVYEPVYQGEYIGGFPTVVLVKDGNARVSTYEECFEYLNYVNARG